MTDIKPEMDVELNPEVAQGIYSNFSILSHSASEFVLDFGRMMPGMPKAEIKSRLILTPEHAKRLLILLQENIDRFENMVGKIEIHTPDVPPITGFGGGIS